MVYIFYFSPQLFIIFSFFPYPGVCMVQNGKTGSWLGWVFVKASVYSRGSINVSPTLLLPLLLLLLLQCQCRLDTDVFLLVSLSLCVCVTCVLGFCTLGLRDGEVGAWTQALYEVLACLVSGLCPGFLHCASSGDKAACERRLASASLICLTAYVRGPTGALLLQKVQSYLD